MNELDQIRVLRAVAQTESVTRAAALLGLDKARVSRVLRAFEVAQGVPLVSRTTRQLRLTREGEALNARLAPLLSALDEALHAGREAPGKSPSGVVTLTTTPELGRALVAPLVGRCRLRFPQLSLRVVLTHDVKDLVGDDVDLALRVGKPGNASLMAKRLGELEAGFYASPAWLERRGTPKEMGDFSKHDTLWPRYQPARKAFSAVGVTPQAAPALECQDFDFLLEVARAGAGVALLPSFIAAPAVATGALVRVVPQVSLRSAPLYLVSRPERPLPARVAALREVLVSEIPPLL